MDKLIQNVIQKRNEDGLLEIELEFKDNQTEEEKQEIADFIISLVDLKNRK